MGQRVFYQGGRWWDRPVCWLATIWQSLKFGVLFHGIRASGHRWRETADSKWTGQHLVCDQCGREAVAVDDGA